jgi:pyridoxamine 5'-phosphate oxidase
MDDFLKALRDKHADFNQGELNEQAEQTPFPLFERWYKEAYEAKELEPNACSISTVSAEGKPSSRIVYLKELVNETYVFYTNYESQKGRALQRNPFASLLFFWPGLQRQVRVEGICQKVADEVNDAYFLSRPRESQLGAWASLQSQKIANRDVLSTRLLEFDKRFPDEVPRPPYWGGYQLQPTLIEFWQGRPSRLHDRIVFECEGERWIQSRKNP